jgi:hypothetical protein
MLRYYPGFSVITNQNTSGNEFISADGKPYSGKYYTAFDGRVFSGPDPQTGPSEELRRAPVYESAPGLSGLQVPNSVKNKLASIDNLQSNRVLGLPTSFYPQPTAADYKRGYLIRYFTKKENEKGFITEISEIEYNDIVNGTADYDIRLYQTTKILWKITGPLNSQRKSQYNIIPGIIDTNKRLTEEANKTFLGIVDYIGGDYTKFARPTA